MEQSPSPESVAANFREQCGHSRANPRAQGDVLAICSVWGASGEATLVQLVLESVIAPGWSSQIDTIV